jgi:parallel beta-helix repeat protein
VKDKGATGNGSTNDTVAIQAAINQVAGSGGTVLVPDGTYMINAVTSLFLKSNMTLRMTGGAVLKAIPNNMANYKVLNIENASNVNVIGGKVQGERAQHQGTSGEYGYGIALYASNKVVIEGVTATDMWGDGFYISRNSSNVTACSIIADNNRRQGMSIVSADGIVVKNSIFKNSNGIAPMAGIDIEPNPGETVNNVQILNSQILNNKGWGILLYGGTGPINKVTIDGNTVANNSVTGGDAEGIKVTRTSGGHRITNNIVKNNLQDGISLTSGASLNIVSGNTVTGNGIDTKNGIGILMYSNATNNTITNNTVTGNKNRNIWDLVGGNTISGNTAP